MDTQRSSQNPTSSLHLHCSQPGPAPSSLTQTIAISLSPGFSPVPATPTHSPHAGRWISLEPNSDPVTLLLRTAPGLPPTSLRIIAVVLPVAHKACPPLALLRPHFPPLGFGHADSYFALKLQPSTSGPLHLPFPFLDISPCSLPHPLEALVQITPVQRGFSLAFQISLDSRALFLPLGTVLGWGPGPCPASQAEERLPGLTLDLGPRVSRGSRQQAGHPWCRGLARRHGRPPCRTHTGRPPWCRWESPASSSTYLTGADSDPHSWPEGAATAPPGSLMGNSTARVWLSQTLTHLTPPSLCHWKSHLPLAREAPALCSQDSIPTRCLCPSWALASRALPPAALLCLCVQPEGPLLLGNLSVLWPEG